MSQEAIQGFKILMIRNVPMGCVLNASTAESYPLRECGTWISDDGNWMIQHSYNGLNLQLIPISPLANTYFFNRIAELVGTLDEIQNFIKEYNGKSPEKLH